MAPPVYSIEKLSESTDGKGKKVTGTTAGTSVDIHIAAAGAGDIDLVTLWVINRDANGAGRMLYLGWGAEADPDNIIPVPVPANAGPVMCTVRLPIMNGLTITAWADAANVLVVYGRVERVDK